MYYVCPTCGEPLTLVSWMRFDAKRRPRFDTPQVVSCPNCGVHRGPPSERRVKRELWRNLLIWAMATVPFLLICVSFALWGGDPFMASWLAISLAALVVVGLLVTLLVSLVHRRKARRIMAWWQPYRREGEVREGAGHVPLAA